MWHINAIINFTLFWDLLICIWGIYAMSHNNQKKIAVINDFSGFGRCSITVALPIISAMGIQCCAVPTAIFSNHTGYNEFFFDDYTDKMEPYFSMWKKLDLKFEGIITGFLGSKNQIKTVEKFISEFTSHRTVVIVDPVMGDNGRLYSTYTAEMCAELKKLIPMADILTPNLTEACILTDTPYTNHTETDMRLLLNIAEKLCTGRTEKVVITGIPSGEMLNNLVYEANGKYSLIKTVKIGEDRAGTGDVFSSIIAADAVNGVDFTESVKKAGQFIAKSVKRSIELELPVQDGICFEEFLKEL